MLDEPTAGMNDADWLPIADLLDRLRSEGLTVVVVEHNMRLLERSCDRVAVIAAARSSPRTSRGLPASTRGPTRLLRKVRSLCRPS